MIFNNYCPLILRAIEEWKCVEITAELGKAKKVEHVKEIEKIHKLTKEEMIKICEACPNYPFHE